MGSESRYTPTKFSVLSKREESNGLVSGKRTCSSKSISITPAKRFSNIAQITTSKLNKPTSKKVCQSNIDEILDHLAHEAVHVLSHLPLSSSSTHISQANLSVSSDSDNVIPPFTFFKKIGLDYLYPDTASIQSVKLPLHPILPSTHKMTRPVSRLSPPACPAHRRKDLAFPTVTPSTARAAQYLLALHR